MGSLATIEDDDDNDDIGRYTSGVISRDRFLMVHKKLHNHKIKEINPLEKDIDELPLPKLKSDEEIRTIKKHDLRRYLGDPLPLPYNTDHKQTNNKPLRNYYKKTRSEPIGKSAVNSDFSDPQKRLQESLKSFSYNVGSKVQRRGIMVDRSTQTDPLSYRINTSHDYRSIIESFRKDMSIDNVDSPIQTPPESPNQDHDGAVIDPMLTSTFSSPTSMSKGYQNNPSPRKSTHWFTIMISSPLVFFVLLWLMYYYFIDID